MENTNVLLVGSIVALVLRVIAIVILGIVAKIQFDQFRNNTELQPLKKLLFSFNVFLIGSQIPIIYLHLIRIAGNPGPALSTAVATVFNAIAMLTVAIVLYLVYKFAAKE